MPDHPYSNVDEYIATCASAVQPILAEMRATVHAAAPDLSEKISWGMPTFVQKKIVVQFMAHAKHIGFYPGPQAIEHFSGRISVYKTSKGTIQFSLDRPIPYDLVADIVRYNITAR